jgi:prevent-host-death family protein
MKRRRHKPLTTLSSREFNQDTGRAKSAAKRGPVIITDRGRPSHVLLSFEAYQRLTGRDATIVDLLGSPPGVEDAALEIPTLQDPARPADLS